MDRKWVLIFALLLTMVAGCIGKPEVEKEKGGLEMKGTSIGDVGVTWFGHATFKIEEKVVIYTDPFAMPSGQEKADIILVTHDHYDHCDVAKIEQVQKEGTTIVTLPACAAKLSGDVRTVKEGDSLTVKDVKIEVVPAYNIGKPYHPKGKGVGFVITIGGQKIYHAGDTDFIPEMKELNVDLALLPIGGTYTMNAEEASDATAVIKPKVVIPMHYKYISGTEADPENFKRLVGEKDPNIEVRILI
jgi:L-ascorbate metabolism protein UlaG (beta-lactamase superfamily)